MTNRSRMIRSKTIIPITAALLVLFMVASAFADEPTDRFVDLGSAADNDQAAGIYLYPPDSFWGGSDWREFIRYEDEKSFYWVTSPPDPSGMIAARVLKSWYSGELRVKPLAAGSTIHLAIRYKDNLVEPTSVEYLAGSGYRKLGALGGAQDHAWKTQVFTVPVAKLTIDKDRWSFRLGRGDYGDLMGDLPLDWVRVSTAPIKPEADMPGFYPKRATNPFEEIGKTQVYRPGDQPMFPVGVCIKGFRTNTFDVLAESGINAVIYQSWEQNWGPGQKVYANGPWPDRLSAGMPVLLDLAKKSKVPFSPGFFTEMRSWWIANQFKGEPRTLEALEEAFKINKKHPALLAWWIKDEADHNDSRWGAPEEFVQQVYNLQKKLDPDRPAFVNFQAWKPGQIRRYLDTADIVGFDAYPVGRGESGLEIADRCDRLREEAAGRKALWAIVEGHEGEHVKKIGRTQTKAETLVQGYIALVHGMQGIFYYLGNQSEYLDPSEIPEIWSGISQMAKEILDEKEGMLPYLVPPGKVVELAASGKQVKSSNRNLHVALFERPGKPRLLVTVNIDRDELKNVKVSCPGLKPGQKLTELFEGRTVEVAADGSLVLDYPPWGRRVFLVGE